jgi:hypothetical protein
MRPFTTSRVKTRLLSTLIRTLTSLHSRNRWRKCWKLLGLIAIWTKFCVRRCLVPFRRHLWWCLMEDRILILCILNWMPRLSKSRSLRDSSTTRKCNSHSSHSSTGRCRLLLCSCTPLTKSKTSLGPKSFRSQLLMGQGPQWPTIFRLESPRSKASKLRRRQQATRSQRMSSTKDLKLKHSSHWKYRTIS